MRKTKISTKTPKSLRVPVTIVGGGLSGLALSCILADQGMDVVCIDREDPHAQTQSTLDGRTIAISLGSRKILEAAGIWDDIFDLGCPIQNIHITDNGSPVLLHFLSHDIDVEAFGWIFDIQRLRKAFVDRVRTLKTLTHLAPAQINTIKRDDDHVHITLKDGRIIQTDLLVGADGRRSFVRDWAGIGTREWPYNQSALVCTVSHENPHNGLAVEDFRKEGPFAILPMKDDEKGHHRSSVVWSIHGPDAPKIANWEDNVFEAGLQSRFPASYGAIKLAGKRFSYPLGLVHAHRYTAPRVALVADAAHGIHPIAGQGLNLGYRDLAALSELLVEAHRKGQDCGSEDILRTYQHKRRFDNMAMAGTTDILNRLFSNGSGTIGLMRKIGLVAVQNISPVRKFFMRQAMGQAGILPLMLKDQ